MKIFKGLIVLELSSVLTGPSVLIFFAELGSNHPNIFSYGKTFLTKDKKQILLAFGNDKQFKAFCEMLDKNKNVDLEKFSTNFIRVKFREN